MSRNEFSRREVIRAALTAVGLASVAGPTTLLAAENATPDRAGDLTSFSPADVAWLDEVAETILPETDTPGAKAAEVGAFIAVMVTDTYSPDEQAAFREGMTQLEARCEAMHGRDWISASADQRLSLLEQLDGEALTSGGLHYFSKIKGLAVLGYFTSEIGYTQAMRYVETPGRFDPCIDYSPGEKIWASHA